MRGRSLEITVVCNTDEHLLNNTVRLHSLERDRERDFVSLRSCASSAICLVVSTSKITISNLSIESPSVKTLNTHPFNGSTGSTPGEVRKITVRNDNGRSSGSKLSFVCYYLISSLYNRGRYGQIKVFTRN